MGWKGVTALLKILKTDYSDAFSAFKDDIKFLEDIHTKDNFDNIHVLIDLNLLIIPILSSLTNKIGIFPTGLKILEPIFKLNDDYLKFHLADHPGKLKSVVNVFDGLKDKRPKTKEHRPITTNLVMHDPQDIKMIRISDESFPSIKVFQSNIANVEFRRRVFKYFTIRLTEHWRDSIRKYGRRFNVDTRNINFHIINGTTKEYLCSDLKLNITGKLFGISNQDSKYACEGEQSIFQFIENLNETRGMSRAKHLCIVVSQDSDCINYANESLIKHSQWLDIYLRCKISPMKKVRSAKEAGKRFYTINMRKLRRGIFKRHSGVKIQIDFDWPRFVLTVMGIFSGNDFVAGMGSIMKFKSPDSMIDRHHPSGKLKRCSFKHKSLIDALKVVMVNDKRSIFRKRVSGGCLMYKINTKMVLKACEMVKIKCKIFTPLQKHIIKVNLRNSQWCMGYFGNPGNDIYVNNFDVKYKGKSVFGYVIEEDGYCYRTTNINS